jgi:hypothetical protein
MRQKEGCLLETFCCEQVSVQVFLSHSDCLNAWPRSSFLTRTATKDTCVSDSLPARLRQLFGSCVFPSLVIRLIQALESSHCDILGVTSRHPFE